MNLKIHSNFITEAEAEIIKNYGNEFVDHESKINNEDIRMVNEQTNGWSVACDLTKTEPSQKVSFYQGDATNLAQVPQFFMDLADRIATTLVIDQSHVFFQYIHLGTGGKVLSHYDLGLPGYITYKCNVFVDGPEEDSLSVDKINVPLKKYDLYCFEASLFRHSMESTRYIRTHLSYGFLLPYQDLGWSENDPRVRLSQKIWRKF